MNGLPEETCKQLLESFFKEFSLVKPWIKKQHDSVKQNGYVTGILGRKRRLPPELAKTNDGNDLLREGQNAVIQQAASDFNLMLLKTLIQEVIPESMELREDVNVIFSNTVHDSIVFEVDERVVGELYLAYNQALEKVNNWYKGLIGNTWVNITADAEVGKSYGDMYKIHSVYYEDKAKYPTVWVEKEEKDSEGKKLKLKAKFTDFYAMQFEDEIINWEDI